VPAPSPDVDAYIAALAGDARTITQHVRQLVHDAAPGVTESIRYQMPCFQVDGKYLVYVGAWKRHIGMYPIPTFDGGLERDIADSRAAKDTIQFQYSKPIPDDLIKRLVAELVTRNERST
jgi:uncharacterized protein YdhG (YjbR/CyaY superfamily)